MFPVFDEINKLKAADCHELAFTQAVLGIEFLGAILDDKPLRASKQSNKRFTIGLRKTFPKRYGNPSVVTTLYKAVRCNLSHLMVTSNRVTFTEDHALHLMIKEGCIFIDQKVFVSDFLNAVALLETRIKEGTLVLKKGLTPPLNNVE